MLNAETLHPKDLTAADSTAWLRLAETEVGYASPLLGPDFAKAVGVVREDARVCIWRRDGRAVGFLAYHWRPGGHARAIGAPFSDYHGPVAEPGLDCGAALKAAGLAAFRFTSLIDPAGVFAGGVSARTEAFVVELAGPAEAYLDNLRAASPKRFKNYRRLDHKLDREVGPLRIVAPDRSAVAFEQLIAWKRDQMVRTGVHDVLNVEWTRKLMRNLFESQVGNLHGMMINLYAGDRLVAGHFGVRRGGAYHPWIASTDPGLAAWSPGQVFLGRAINAMDDLCLTTYDLGPTHDHYKRPYVLRPRWVGEGLATAATLQGHAARMTDRAWDLAGARRAGAVSGLRRRLEVIAAVELTLGGRARALASALAARAPRAISHALQVG